jgi:hypothetical protein
MALNFSYIRRRGKPNALCRNVLIGELSAHPSKLGLPQIGRVIASNPQAVMKIFSTWKLIVLGLLVLTLVGASRAIADDIDPDADVPDISTMNDTTPPNPVLEIPQQCDQDSVAVLCDRSSEDNSSTSTDATALAGPSVDADGANDSNADDSNNDVANNPNVGSVYDYANQNITNEASALGTMSVPLGGGLPGYPALAPSPVVVSSGPGSYQQGTSGPGAYQQWATGPGSYRQWAPGPGYMPRMPLGYHPYGAAGAFAHSFGGHFGAAHFGGRR